MKCFTHRDTDAVAVCKQCGKAVCENCMVVGATGISCRGACAEQVGGVPGAAAPVISRRRKILQLSAAFLALIACVFLYLALREALDFDPEVPGASPVTYLFWAAFLFFQAGFSFWMSRLSLGR
jgi:hypothetical protein